MLHQQQKIEVLRKNKNKSQAINVQNRNSWSTNQNTRKVLCEWVPFHESSWTTLLWREYVSLVTASSDHAGRTRHFPPLDALNCLCVCVCVCGGGGVLIYIYIYICMWARALCIRLYNNPAPVMRSIQFHYCTVSNPGTGADDAFVLRNATWPSHSRPAIAAGARHFQICSVSPLIFWQLVCSLCLPSPFYASSHV